MHTTEGHLQATPPFDFAKSLAFLEFFTPTADEQIIEEKEQTLTKATKIGDQTVAFKLADAGNDRLHYTLFSERPLTDEVTERILQRITVYLSLDDDLKPFYEIAEDDASFKPVVEQLYGYHQVKFLTPFESACWAVLSTRNRIATATKMKSAIMEQFGSSITVAGKTYPAFPEPADILAADEDDLIEIVRNSRRTEYLQAAAAAFDSVDESWLYNGDLKAVKNWVLDIKGIGAWSASFILIRALGRMERLDAPEKRLVEAATQLYGELLDEEAVTIMAERYGDYRGYWAHYIRVIS